MEAQNYIIGQKLSLHAKCCMNKAINKAINR